MPIINVVKKFKLHHPRGIFTDYLVGQHEVDDEVANHEYVKVHTAPIENKLFKMQTPIIPVDEPVATPKKGPKK